MSQIKLYEGLKHGVIISCLPVLSQTVHIM